MTKLSAREEDLWNCHRALTLARCLLEAPPGPTRDLLKEEAGEHQLCEESRSFQKFIETEGEGDALYRIASSWRNENGRTEFSLTHSALLSVSTWDCTDGHRRSRRKLIELLEQLQSHCTAVHFGKLCFS